MADKTTEEVIEEQKKVLTEDIKPEDIVIDDDSDMPEPETKQYTQKLTCTDKFLTLFHESIGAMPYATTLTNAQGGKIKLIDLVKYVEANYRSIGVNELNTIIGFIANADFKYVRPLMELVEQKETQAELWTLSDSDGSLKEA